MQGSEERDVVVVGGGLVGALLSIMLARRGAEVEVCERRPDPRQGAAAAGRSINLVVTSRGFRALARAGLDEAVRKFTVPVTGRMIHDLGGALAYQPYGRDESECNHSVSRAELNRFLIDAAERAGVRFRFECPVMGADLRRGRLTLPGPRGGSVEVTARTVFGADGAASAIRSAMVESPGYVESIEPLDSGYKELEIPAGPGGAYRIEKNALHIWPRRHTMLMALPNLDGSFTVTLYMPHEGRLGFDAHGREDDVRSLFESQFPDALELIPDLGPAFLANPTGVLGTVRCSPWHVGGRALLLGDAAHAVVPFFGQGMNCGFEDCSVLDTLLEEHGLEATAKVFPAFTAARKPNADAIADMALENFVEMREHVGDPRFLLRKQIEHRLEVHLPLEYRSRYSMVMYSSIPYGIAQEAGRIQEGILAELCTGLRDADDLDLELARGLIDERLTPFLRAQSVSLDY